MRPPAILDPRQIPAVCALIHRWYRATPLLGHDRRSQETDFCARWRRILFADPCSYCGGVVETVDHVHPRSRGGGSSWWNYTGACMACNTRKGATPLLLFVLQRGRGRERQARLTLAASAAQHLARPGRFNLVASRLAAALNLVPSGASGA